MGAWLRLRYSIVTVLGLVGGAPGGETPRVADRTSPEWRAKLLVSYKTLAFISAVKKDKRHVDGKDHGSELHVQQF